MPHPPERRATFPDEAEPVRPVLQVRTNRRRFLLTAAVSFPVTCALPWLVGPYDVDETAKFIIGVISGLPAGLAGGSIALALRRVYLTYDAGDRTIRGPSARRNNVIYPRVGYDRLEYSPSDRRIYEVSAEGARRRLMFRRWVADPRDWEALVDLMIAHNGSNGVQQPMTTVVERFERDLGAAAAEETL